MRACMCVRVGVGACVCVCVCKLMCLCVYQCIHFTLVFLLYPFSAVAPPAPSLGPTHTEPTSQPSMSVWEAAGE